MRFPSVYKELERRKQTRKNGISEELRKTKGRNTLSSNATIPQNPHPLPDQIPHANLILPPLILPLLSLLPLVHVIVLVRVHERRQDDPLCNLRSVDAIGGREGDLRVGVDGVFGDVVDAGGEEVDEVKVRCIRGGLGEAHECDEDGSLCEDFCQVVRSLFLCLFVLLIMFWRGCWIGMGRCFVRCRAVLYLGGIV